MPGISISSVTRSGESYRVNSRAFCPLKTDPTTCTFGIESSAVWIAPRKIRESSTIKTRMSSSVAMDHYLEFETSERKSEATLSSSLAAAVKLQMPTNSSVLQRNLPEQCSPKYRSKHELPHRTLRENIECTPRGFCDVSGHQICSGGDLGDRSRDMVRLLDLLRSR